MDTVTNIKEAGKNKKILKFQYIDKKGQTTYREGEVYKLESDKVWIFDTQKADHIRQFFLDKISETIVTNLDYTERNGWLIEVGE